MKKYIHIFSIWLMVLSTLKFHGQDPNYTQFFNNPTYFNPAYSGLSSDLRVQFAFREQWPALPYDFKAYHFDLDARGIEGRGFGGIGIFINSDNEGIAFIKNLNIGLSVAARIKLGEKGIVQVGMKASWLQKSVKWEDFIFSDNLSKRYGNIFSSGYIPPEGNTRNMADFGCGGIIQLGNNDQPYSVTAGLAVDHLFQPDQSLLQNSSVPLHRKIVGHIDFVFSAAHSNGTGGFSDGALNINPGVIFQRQGDVYTLQGGLNLSKYGMNIGAWYKGNLGASTNSCLALLAGFGVSATKNMDVWVSYSYDIQISKELSGTGGAHELTLIVDFGGVGLFGSPPIGGSWKRKTPWECADW